MTTQNDTYIDGAERHEKAIPVQETNNRCPNCGHYKVILVRRGVFEDVRRVSWLPFFKRTELVDLFEHTACMNCHWEGDRRLQADMTTSQDKGDTVNS